MLEEKMKQAFMRGVCALNREALAVFKESEAGAANGQQNGAAAVAPAMNVPSSVTPTGMYSASQAASAAHTATATGTVTPSGPASAMQYGGSGQPILPLASAPMPAASVIPSSRPVAGGPRVITATPAAIAAASAAHPGRTSARAHVHSHAPISSASSYSSQLDETTARRFAPQPHPHTLRGKK